MPISVWSGSAWTKIKALPVWNGSAWVSARKAKTWDGSKWVLTWVPPVPAVTISFSKTGVQVGETFNVTITYAGGWPEGTQVRVTTNTGYDTTFNTTEGATTVVITGVSHGAVGSPVWSAYATNLGGTSTTATKTQTVTAATPTHYHVVVPSGSSGSTIQAEMDKAYNWWIANKGGSTNFDDEQTFACVELVASGSYQLSTALHPRRGVRLVGAGSGSTRPTIYGNQSSHVMSPSDNGGGSYNSPHYDWMVHNIIFDCEQYTGGISVAHTRRFQVSSCFFKRMGGKKHYIEINSSGGARTDGTYNCRIINCEFTNSDKNTLNGQPRRTEDECIQLDYSWTGAAPGVANDGTITNNVMVTGCNFHEAPRAIGSHHWEAGTGGEAYPDNLHANILIQSNTFKNINPITYGDTANGPGSEGAVRAYAWENVNILNNTFVACYQPINLYLPSDAVTTYGNPDYFRIAANTLDDCNSGRNGIYGTSGHASLKFSRVLIEGNVVTGNWSSSPGVYFAGCDDTTGSVAGFTQGCVIRNNVFKPDNYDLAGEKAYNKYRAQNTSNATGVAITGNTVSDGSEDNT